MSDPALFLSLVSLILFLGLMVMLRPFMTARAAMSFAYVLAGFSMAAAVGASVLTWWAR